MIGKYDEMGVLAIVCFSLAVAIIVIAMTIGSHARPETPVSCKQWLAWCDVRAPRPAEHWHYGNCNIIIQVCDIG
jgi:ABC-type uncharacterized transport system YnjBCD permease subunit